MQSFKSQPKALVFLFLTEMWERFGFYVVQGLLVLFMTQYYQLPDSQSYMILGAFTSLAYISPIVGGYLADKMLGFKTSIIWGAVFLILGYVLLALPLTQSIFYFGLSTIIVGNGLFKPNISSLLGAQYETDDSRREAGFTIFYIGINMGATLAGFSSGYIKNAFGWHISFGIASIGLAFGLATFLYGLRHMQFPAKQPKPSFNFKSRLFIYCLIAIAGLHFLMTVDEMTTYLLPVVGMILLTYLSFLTLQQRGEDKKNMFVLLLLILSSIVFWTLYLQLFFSANLFIERLVDKNFFGIPLTTTVFYALVSFYIIFLGPMFAWMWHKLSKHECNPSPFTKFTLGLLMTGIAFMILSASTHFNNPNGHIHPIWIFVAYFTLTVGELLISPIGLSAVTLLSPVRLVSMMMGVWFVATGFGGIFAGWLAQLSNVPEGMTNVSDQLLIYQEAFRDYAYIAFVVAIILFFAHNLAKRLEHVNS